MKFVSDDVVHVPLRPGHPVMIHGVPRDLTRAEAERIMRVLRALATKKQD